MTRTFAPDTPPPLTAEEHAELEAVAAMPDVMLISQTNPAIAEAWGVIKVLSADEEARLLAESREKARMDFEDRYDGAYNEGRTEGHIDVALNALRKKMPLDVVVELTGLSIAEVEQLAAGLSG